MKRELGDAPMLLINGQLEIIRQLQALLQLLQQTQNSLPSVVSNGDRQRERDTGDQANTE